MPELASLSLSSTFKYSFHITNKTCSGGMVDLVQLSSIHLVVTNIVRLV